MTRRHIGVTSVGSVCLSNPERAEGVTKTLAAEAVQQRVQAAVQPGKNPGGVIRRLHLLESRALLWVILHQHNGYSSHHIHRQEAQAENQQAQANHLLRFLLDLQTFRRADVQMLQGDGQTTVAEHGHQQRKQKTDYKQNKVDDKVDIGQIFLIEGETLRIVLIFFADDDGEDERLQNEQKPNSCAELLDEPLAFHARAPFELHHRLVAMDADEGEEYGAAVKVYVQQGELGLTQQLLEVPVVPQGEVHGHHGSEGGGDGVAEGQVELQRGPRGPAGQPAAEDPHAEGVEDEAGQEDQAEEDGGGHGLVLPGAKL